MDRTAPEDWISAYFDGEAAPAERDEVERLLLQSEDVRRELEETAQLSGLLQSLPAEAAPVEFVPAVMQRIERETLLPLAPSNPRRSKRRNLAVVLLGLGVTVAAVLVLALPLQRPDESSLALRDEPASATARGEFAEAFSDEKLLAESSGLNDEVEFGLRYRSFGEESGADVPHLRTPRNPEAPAPGARLASQDVRNPSRSTARPFSAGATRSPAAEEPSAGAGHIAPASPRSRYGINGQARMSVRDEPVRERESDVGTPDRGGWDKSWNGIRIGDVVPYFTQWGDQVAVVDLLVVDMQRSAGELQVLLTRNSIIPEPAEQQKAANSELKDDLVAIYVEATPDQLRAALDEMQHQDLFVDARLQEPVHLAGIQGAQTNEASALRLQESREANDEAELLTEDEGTAASSLASRASRPERAKVQDPRQQGVPPALVDLARNSAAPTSAPAALEESLSRAVRLKLEQQSVAKKSFQMNVDVPDDVARLYRRGRVERDDAVKEDDSHAPADRDPSGTRPLGQMMAHRGPVRVIFILQEARGLDQRPTLKTRRTP